MAGTEPLVRWRPGHGWLAAVLPASARTFRSADPGLAATLAASGAEERAERPDVELAVRAADLRGDAGAAIVFASRPAREGSGLPVRVAGRLAGWAAVGAESARGRRRMAALGYADVDIVAWDHARQPEIALGAGPRRRASDHARLPLAALVVGTRGDRGAASAAGAQLERGPTIVEEAARAAGSSPSDPLAAVPRVGLSGVVARAGIPGAAPPDLLAAVPRVGLSGVVLAIGERAVLRVVMAAGADQVERGSAFLAALRAAGPGAGVAGRIAWPVAAGELPLARWVAEPRLPGAPARPPVAPPLLDDCVGFLAELFRTPARGGPASPDLKSAARVVAAACPPPLDRDVAALGERLEAQLAGVPRGPGHGDFWTENLLVEGGRLRGVVDWSGASAARLPLTDLLHLLAAAEQARADRQLGEVVVDWLLPAATAGELPGVAAYCGRIGLEADRALVRRLAIAYWLDHVAAHLSGYADRAARPAWLRPNVVDAAKAIVSGSS